MNSTEQLQLDVIAKVCVGKLCRKQAQQILNISERTLRRYLKAYAKSGPTFVKHGNYKKAPINSSSLDLKKKVKNLVREKYFDFNLTHCLEKLEKDEGIVVCRETFRLWCHEIGMVKKAKRRQAKVRRRRDRMAQRGIMLQMDGSPHHWFGGKPSCLIGAIDDADSDVPFAEFFPAEDTISCMTVLQKIVEKSGIFQILYVDRAGIFGGPKRAHFSQVKRALGELGIHIIFANSPEAKGRIERLWGTLQDRLIPEMRIRNIKGYDGANDYLQNQFLPNEYATKFKVQPESLESAYKPLPTGINLNEIFCLKEYRSCKRDHTFSFGNEIYRIDSSLKNSIYKQRLEIRTYQDLTWKVFFAGKPIEVSLVKEPEKINNLKAPEVAEVQEINAIKVRLDGHIFYRSRYYSVDEKYVGQKVTALENDTQVLIYFKGKQIESHRSITGSQQLCSTKPEHLSLWQRALQADSMYRKAAIRYGTFVDQLVLQILEQGNGFIDNSSIWAIIGLDKTYHADAINKACKHALEVNSPTYKAVKIFLTLQPGATHLSNKQLKTGTK